MEQRVEHHLFSFVTKNWRGKTLTSYRTIVELVWATKAKTGLKVLSEWDQGSYPRRRHHRHRPGGRPVESPRVARRVELHHPGQAEEAGLTLI